MPIWQASGSSAAALCRLEAANKTFLFFSYVPLVAPIAWSDVGQVQELNGTGVFLDLLRLGLLLFRQRSRKLQLRYQHRLVAKLIGGAGVDIGWVPIVSDREVGRKVCDEQVDEDACYNN